jgi:hypothetical protein
MKNRIWIELDRPGTTDEAVKYAKIANAMLAQLGINQEFYWDEKTRYWWLIQENDRGYLVMVENGHWFNFTEMDAVDPPLDLSLA